MKAGKKHPRTPDLIGQRFGKLTIEALGKTDGKSRWWVCRCDCGQTCEKIAGDLRKDARAGRESNCGCSSWDRVREKRTTHGMSRHPVYAVWRSMVDRCRLPSHQAWKNYGGRGITVCPEWSESFDAFWRDMGPTYKTGLQLDRRQNDEGYSAENCRWVEPKVNSRNKRSNRFVEYDGEKITVSEASQRTGIGVTTLLYRLDRGLTGPELFSKPDVRNRFTTS